MNTKFGAKVKKGLGKLAGYGIWLLIVLLVISTSNSIGNSARVKAQIKAEEEKVSRMQKENADLENRVILAQSGDYIEAEIRNKLGLVKSGEAIVVLPDVETLKKLAPPEALDQEALPDPNWKKWAHLFF